MKTNPLTVMSLCEVYMDECLELVHIDMSSSYPVSSIEDIASGNVYNLGSHVLNKILQAVYECVLWSIWKRRNTLVNPSPDLVDKVRSHDVFPSIQRVSKLWISSRAYSPSARWSSWLSNPLEVILEG
ncbi:hypothetical protein Tco_0746832 [Tanacetum coccineum]